MLTTVPAVALPVDVQNDFLDWAGAVVGVLVLLVTLAAVIVALLPMLQARRRVPDPQLLTHEVPGAFNFVRELVSIYNPSGNDAARGVQVYGSMRRADAPELSAFAVLRQPLPFEGRDGHWQRKTDDVPSGFSRPVRLLLIDDFDRSSDRVDARFGSVERTFSLRQGRYRVVLDVVGDNFDAFSAVGEVEVRYLDEMRLQLRWTSALSRKPYEPNRDGALQMAMTER